MRLKKKEGCYATEKEPREGWWVGGAVKKGGVKGEKGERKALTRSEAKIKRRWESKFYCRNQDEGSQFINSQREE